MTDAKPQDVLSDNSLGLAAQAWCEPETSHKLMDEELCKAFARILDRALAQSDAEPKRAQLRLEEDAQGKRAMLGGYQMSDALVSSLEAQSNAEPVGVLHNTEGGFREVVTRDTTAIYDNYPQLRFVEEILDFDRKLIGFRVYDAPPRPDASAGLIEAAKHLTASADQIKKQAESLLDVGTDECKEQAAELAIIEPCLRAEANYLRARAADRSGK
jgi:hypothetical protein